MWQSRAGAGVLVVKNDRLLMVLRERAGRVRWELPSGLLQSGESFEQAAARETLEETGITVEVGDLLCTVVIDVPSETYRGVNAYFYATAQSDETPRVNTHTEPVKEAKFVELDSLKPSKIHPVDWRILSRWRRISKERAFFIYLTL
jgi:8-oxo-dGTP diphosphatase